MSDATMDSGVRQALLLVEGPFLLDTPERSEDPFAPAYSLLGVPLIVRALRQLQDAGVEHSVVILPREREKTAEIVKEDFRIGHKVDFLLVDEADAYPAKIKEALGFFDGGPAFLCRSNLIAPPSLHSFLARDIPEKGLRIGVFDGASPRGEYGLSRDGDSRKSATGEKARKSLVASALMSGEFIEALKDRDGDLPKTFTAFSEGGKIESRQVDDIWFRVLNDGNDLKIAENMLLQSLRKPIDGFIARTINRRISIPISRVLAFTPISPNMASAFTVPLSLAAIWAVTNGGYWWMLFGAALFQFASIIDGVDGELARLKYQFSKYGEWFDTIADDISNFLFFAGITYTVWRGVAGPPWLLPFGLVTLGCYMFITPLMYSYIIKYTDSGDVMAIDFEFNKSGSLADERIDVRILAFLKYVVKRDFFIFSILVFALFGVLPYMLIVSAVSAACILSAVIFQHLRAISRKRV